MSNDKDPPRKDPLRKSPDKKSASLNNNVIWFLLILCVVTFSAVSLLTAGSDEKLQYYDLLKLVKVAHEEPGKNSIEVTQGTGDKKQVVTYSDPRDVKIGTHEVTGKITKQVAGGEPTEETFASNVQPLDNRLSELLEKQGIRFDNSDRPSAWTSYIPMLVVTALFVLFIFYMMRRLGGAGSPMAFGRSRGKMYAQEDLGVTFEDVAGIDEAVDELREVVEFLRTPEKYQLLGGRIPKGLLLVGPPGTGKTLLAKAIAGEAGVPFFSLSGSDFVEMFVGVGAARVRDMFQQAEAKSPCIIFIDELDALGKTRGSSIVGGHDEREQTLNALLVEMDGFDSNNGVIVLAASNRPETLDPALLRPGRFDRHVLVDRPDVRGREAILRVHVQSVKLDEKVNLAEVAAITSGFVGADLANLVNEAALLAARKGKSAVGMDEFNDGVERVTAGLEKKQRIIHQDEKLRVAYHESGHALVAYSLPNTDPVHKVSIIPRGLAALGYTLHTPRGRPLPAHPGRTRKPHPGALGRHVRRGIGVRRRLDRRENDLERASGIARSMVMDYGMSKMGRVNYRESSRSPFLSTGNEMQREHSHSEETAREIDQEVHRIINESLIKVRHILQSRMASLEALERRLIEKEVIDSDELKEIIEANSPSPQIVPGTDAERKRNEAAAKLARSEETPPAAENA